MKTENRELLGFNVPVVGIVDTLPEAITAAGSEDAVLKDYVSNVLAHSHYTILRRAIVKKLAEVSGVAPKTKKVGDKDVPDEKEAAYVARLEDELGEERMKTFETAVADACRAITVDYTPGRAGGTGAPAKKWLAYYDQLKSEEKLDAFCSKYAIDTNQEEDSLKFAVANKVREIVTAKLEAAAREAVDV